MMPGGVSIPCAFFDRNGYRAAGIPRRSRQGEYYSEGRHLADAMKCTGMNSRSRIVLTTANARFSHCAFGLLRLAAALRARGYSPEIREFTIQQTPFEITESLLASKPDVVGFGIYIWNVELMRHVVHLVKSVSPRTTLVLGGPEIQGDKEELDLFEGAGYFVKGEGENTFADLVQCLDSGSAPEERVITGTPPRLEELPSPYELYSSEDIENRIVYVESSRGCPYRCAFCLSALDNKVRYFPLKEFFDAMEILLEKGVRLFKFTDRTFNVNEHRMIEILEFFLLRFTPGVQLHLEIMPDRLGKAACEKMAAFPARGLHLEVGLQSFSAEVQRGIGRYQNVERTMDTIAFLRSQTGAVLHADLIIGLPGDDRESVARGFDALVSARVQEIQVGLLKRLRGTPLADTKDEDLVFDVFPPYEILSAGEMGFGEIQQMKRFARYFDMYYNSGNFPESLNLLWESQSSSFQSFSLLAREVWEKEGRTHGIPLARLAERLFEHLCSLRLWSEEEVAAQIERDFRRLPGRLDKLKFRR